MALLEVSGLSKHFGGLAAVNQLDFEVNNKEILGMIGPNGAGKSTVFNMLGGSICPTSGKIIFQGDNITGLPPHRIAGKGITRVFQGNVLFHNLDSVTNVLLGLHLHIELGLWRFLFGSQPVRKREKAMEILQSVGLSEEADKQASSLSHGKQRLLGLAVALATEPKLLLLDEPVTGMNSEEVSDMLNIVKTLRDKRGITSILVEHNMKAVMGLCDRIVTISYGKKIAEGSPKEIAENPAVIEAYLGAEQDAT